MDVSTQDWDISSLHLPAPNSLRISQAKDAVGMKYKSNRVLSGNDALWEFS